MYLSTASLLPAIEQEAIKQGVDPETAKAMFLSENSYFDRGGNLVSKSKVDTGTTSPAGATGLMQVMPDTLAGLVRTGYLSPSGDYSTPEWQIRAGVAAIKDANSRGIKSPMENAVYYNGGQRALDDFRSGRNMNPETTDYLRKFTQHLTGSAPMDSPPTDAPDTTSPTPGSSSMQRLSMTQSKRVLPPGAAEDLSQRSRDFSKLSSDLQTKLQNLSTDMLGGASATNTAIDAETEAKKQQIAASAQKDTITNDSQNSTLSAFGINLNTDPDSVIGRNMKIVAESRDKRLALQDQIEGLKAGVDPITDPVGWLMSSVRQMPLIAQHNALVTQENNAANNIATTQTLAAKQAAIQPASLGTAINAKAVADANAAIAEGEVKKQSVLGVARAHVAQFIIEQGKLAGTDLSHLISVDDVLGTHETTGSAVTEKDKEADDLLKPINTTAQSMGLPPFTKLTFKAMDPSTQQKWVKMSQFGRAGVTPGESAALLYDTYGNAGLTEINKNVPAAGTLMKDVVSQGQAKLDLLESQAITNPKIASQLKMAKNPIDRLALGIDAWNKDMETQADPKVGDFSKLDPHNPYKINYGYAASNPALAGNPLGNTVGNVPKGVQVTDQLLLAGQVADVQKKDNPKPIGQAAQEIYDFYQKGLTRQYSDTRMDQLGFKPRDSYPIMAKVNTVTSQKVDLLNKTSIENWLVRQAASEAAIPAMQGFRTQPLPFPR